MMISASVGGSIVTGHWTVVEIAAGGADAEGQPNWA